MSFGSDLQAASMEVTRETGGALVTIRQPSGDTIVMASPIVDSSKDLQVAGLNVHRSGRMVVPGGQGVVPTTGDKVIQGDREFAVTSVAHHEANGVDVAFELSLSEIGAVES